MTRITQQLAARFKLPTSAPSWCSGAATAAALSPRPGVCASLVEGEEGERGNIEGTTALEVILLQGSGKSIIALLSGGGELKLVTKNNVFFLDQNC